VKEGLRRWWSAVVDAWRSQLWPVPALAVTLAVLLGTFLPVLDAHIDGSLPDAVTAYLFSGGPEAARTVLSVIAGSLITVTSLTFSLTVVTLQLASSQFSPRLLRTFSRDRLVHISLGLLLGTFTYSVTVLRTVRASVSDHEAFVPQIAVTVAYLMALVSVLMLVVFLAHLARQIRVEWMLRQVHAETDDAMQRLLTDASPAGTPTVFVPQASPEAVPLLAASSGFFTSLDEPLLLATAIDIGAVVFVDRLPGDSLIAGTPIAHAWPSGSTGPLSTSAREGLQMCIEESVDVSFERTATQDIAFGLRQIVDVTVKALSPGVNDPTTAVHGLGHVAALLCKAATKDLGPRLLCDQDGAVRVILRRPNFGELLELAVEQPRRYGAADPGVLVRLVTLLREVAWVATAADQRLAITEQAARMTAIIDRQDFDERIKSRLHHEIQNVHLALTGRWPPTSTS
jgi:uncharacterized membrane protein